MLIRSLTLTLLLAIAGPLFAADNDSPIAGDMGRVPTTDRDRLQAPSIRCG